MNVTIDSPAGWLLVSVSTAGAAATLRVQVWRKLRSLGALYLQQSVCLLPARDDVVREVRRLADRVRRQGGSCRLLHVSIADQAELAQVVAAVAAGPSPASQDKEIACGDRGGGICCAGSPPGCCCRGWR